MVPIWRSGNFTNNKLSLVKGRSQIDGHTPLYDLGDYTNIKDIISLVAAGKVILITSIIYVKKIQSRPIYSSDSSLLHTITLLQNRFYLPLLSHRFVIPKKSSHTHIKLIPPLRSFIVLVINFFLCVLVVIILLLPIYIFLYMNRLQAHVSLFHFTRLYKRETFYIQ